ncbi:MAG: SOS response-associated peptidase [Pseudomonadota bacterium]
MPGRVFLSHPLADLAAWLGASAAAEDPGPRADAAPGESFWLAVAGREMRAMRWGMIPMGRKNARGRPVLETVVNARAETVLEKSAFAGTGHAILPVSGWYEWTGKRGRKTRWRIARPGGAPLAFAAIYDVWQAPGGAEVASFATLTVEPSEDVAAYHHRMPVILPEAAWPLWLGEAAGPLAPVLKPAPAGTVEVAEAAEP